MQQQKKNCEDQFEFIGGGSFEKKKILVAINCWWYCFTACFGCRSSGRDFFVDNEGKFSTDLK
jgi:hypothetical protein